MVNGLGQRDHNCLTQNCLTLCILSLDLLNANTVRMNGTGFTTVIVRKNCVSLLQRAQEFTHTQSDMMVSVIDQTDRNLPIPYRNYYKCR